MNEKKALRKELKARRMAMGEAARLEASEKIVSRLLEEEAFKEAGRIFAFWPMAEEVQLQRVFKEAGKEFSFPVCFTEGRMEAYAPRDLFAMKEDRYGIPSPNAEEDLLVPPEEIDLVLAPLLGFDSELYRIGYGGGYYDRYLRRLKKGTPVIGLAYSVQEVEKVPRGPWDLALPLILTEKDRKVRP